MKNIKLIYAANEDGVIGDKGGIPWYVPEDLKKFKELTMGNHVVMGRKTWESLPQPVRPLPGRDNIVISVRDIDALKNIDGIEVYDSIDEVVNQSRWEESPLWVVGGNMIYERFLPHANEVYKTQVKFSCDGDTLAPRLDMQYWKMVSQTPWFTSVTGTVFRHQVFHRIAQG